MKNTPYLRMQGITKTFPGVKALTDVSLEAYAGEATALIGANGAGKSTLMNVLGGVLRADSGDIVIDGQHVLIHSPMDATRSGIAFVHQEMSMLPTMTVAENMMITSFPMQNRLIDQAQMNDRCQKVLDRLECAFTSKTEVRYLSTGDQQMVEIARALLSDARIIIFDEPTSSLTSRERERLFDIIASLKANDVAIIYISHFLDEIFDVCERTTVLRGGRTVGDGSLDDLSTSDIVSMMIGDIDIAIHEKQPPKASGDPALKVTALTRTGVLNNINLTLHQGEVVGLWGLLGSGRTELARAIVGLDAVDGGQIDVRVDGILQTMSPTKAKRYIGYITEDRREEGLLLPMSVKQNMSLANLRALTSRFSLINDHTETTLTQKFVDRLNIVVANLAQPVKTLSGGNQQKVVIGRWLWVDPPIFIMDEPTRGLDVGAKAEIRNIIFELANTGAALLVISSEIEEMMALAHRYFVMNRGQIIAELPADADKNELMTIATGAHSIEEHVR